MEHQNDTPERRARLREVLLERRLNWGWKTLYLKPDLTCEDLITLMHFDLEWMGQDAK